jgi:glycosyltransferase involved in cell wall biosynthesis
VKIFVYTESATDGYGRVCARIRHALAERGVDTSVNGGGKYDLVCASPAVGNMRGRAVFTMWEPSEWLPEHLQWLRRFERVIVPSQHNFEALKKKGFKNVRLCPLGSPLNFQFMPSGPLTFLSVGKDYLIKNRKQADRVVELFLKAFPKEADVRLVVKQSSTCFQIPCFDKRVSIVREILSEDAMRELRNKAHVGVQISGLEGWGYPAHEMIATGRPVIASLWGGHANFLTPECSFPLEYKFCRAPKTVYKGVGVYAQATDASILRAFRWCYENPEDIALRGAMAFKRARHFTNERFGARLWEALK